MDLNFSAGKSECILALAGKGKAKVNKFLYECGNAIDIVINSSKTINLKFPKVYKHVGTKIGANLNAEVFSRCALMVQGAGTLQKKVLQNHGIDISKRLSVLSAYIFTKGTFQCSTWSELSPAATKKLHGIITNLYRYTIGCYHGSTKGIGNITDGD